MIQVDMYRMVTLAGWDSNPSYFNDNQIHSSKLHGGLEVGVLMPCLISLAIIMMFIARKGTGKEKGLFCTNVKN